MIKYIFMKIYIVFCYNNYLKNNKHNFLAYI